MELTSFNGDPPLVGSRIGARSRVNLLPLDLSQSSGTQGRDDDGKRIGNGPARRG